MDKTKTPKTQNNQKKVIIVESPGKCKKIEKMLGFPCIASYGHIMDIPASIKWFSPDKIDPPYEITKPDVVKKLKQICKSKEVIIASDLDREGEAIGENITRVLGLDPKKATRIRFNQITETALRDAIEDGGILDMNLFHAQQARRLVDILFGFLVSPVLWKHIQGRISAGRCQSPTVKLCLERQNLQKPGKTYFEANADLDIPSGIPGMQNITVTKEQNPKSVEYIKSIQKDMTYTDSNEKTLNSSPPPPHTTSTLQQEASKVHGIQPKQCMLHAQKLYEGGFITYMRTDSIFLAESFKNDARNYILEKFGEKYIGSNGKYNGKSNKKVKEQAAHEAIRPIYIELGDRINELNDMEKKVYRLIFMRTMASLMSPAQFSEVTLRFNMNNADNVVKDIWTKKQKNVLFDGYLKLGSYKENKENDIRQYLKKNTNYKIKNAKIKECVEKPPAPYTQASLVRQLEKTGIGRPSTFSAIIEKIQEKGYVYMGTNPSLELELNQYEWSPSSINESKYKCILGGQKNVCIVSPLGEKVTDFLESSCNHLMNIDFTSELEQSLDTIAQGKLEWKSFVSEFYKTVCNCISAIEPPPKVKDKSEKAEIHWIRRSNMITQDGYIYGVIQNRYGFTCVKVKDDKIESYSPLLPSTTYHDIEDDEIHSVFSYPKVIGKKNGNDVNLYLGKYGWYLKIKDENIGLGNLGKLRKPPNMKEIQEQTDKKNIRLATIPGNPGNDGIEWSIWYNPQKDSHFLMKKNNKSFKPQFWGIPNFNSNTKYTTKMCEEISATTFTSRKKQTRKKKPAKALG